jgi:hypothetical protein
MASINGYFVVVFIKIIFCSVFLLSGVLHAQSYSFPSNPYGPSSGVSTSKTSYSIFAGVSSYKSLVTIQGAEPIDAIGDSTLVGIELSSSTAKPVGAWNLGIAYTKQKATLSPNSTKEVDSFTYAEPYLSWGFNLSPRFLFSFGAKTQIGIGPIYRNSNNVTTELSYQDFGINAFQIYGFAAFRYYQLIRRKPRIFVDIKYCAGLTDRALGENDRWQENTTDISLGVIVF